MFLRDVALPTRWFQVFSVTERPPIAGKSAICQNDDFRSGSSVNVELNLLIKSGQTRRKLREEARKTTVCGHEYLDLVVHPGLETQIRTDVLDDEAMARRHRWKGDYGLTW